MILTEKTGVFRTEDAFTKNLAGMAKQFGPNVTFTITVLSKRANVTGKNTVTTPFTRLRRDGLDEYRADFDNAIKSVISQKGNRITYTKYLTVSVKVDKKEKVDRLLGSIEDTLILQASKTGYNLKVVDGAMRARIVRDVLNLGDTFTYSFDWSLVNKYGVTTKDYVAPGSMEFTSDNLVKVTDNYNAIVALQLVSNRGSIESLAEFAYGQDEQVYNISFKRVSIKEIKSKINYNQEAKSFLDACLANSEDLFEATILLRLVDKNPNELRKRLAEQTEKARELGFRFLDLNWQTEEALFDTCCMGTNETKVVALYGSSTFDKIAPMTLKKNTSYHGLYYGNLYNSDEPVFLDDISTSGVGLYICDSKENSIYAMNREALVTYLSKDTPVVILDATETYDKITDTTMGNKVRLGDGISRINILESMDKYMLGMLFKSISEDNLGNQEEFKTSDIDKLQEYMEDIKSSTGSLTDLISLLRGSGIDLLSHTAIAVSIKLMADMSKLDCSSASYVDISQTSLTCIHAGHLNPNNQLIEQLIWLSYLAMPGVLSAGTTLIVDGAQDLFAGKFSAEFVSSVTRRLMLNGVRVIFSTDNPHKLFNTKACEDLFKLKQYIMLVGDLSDYSNMLFNYVNISVDTLKSLAKAEEHRMMYLNNDVSLLICEGVGRKTSSYKLLSNY